MRLSIILWNNNAEVWVICRCRMLRQRTKTQSLIITTSCEIDRRVAHRGNYIGQKTLSIMMLTLSKWHMLNRESAPRDHMAMIGKLSSVPKLTRRKPKGKVPRSKRVASCPPSPLSPQYFSTYSFVKGTTLLFLMAFYISKSNKGNTIKQKG